MKKVKVAIFASGTGSNALALIKKAKSLTDLEISLVLSDKATAGVLEKARHENVSAYLVEKKTDKSAHEKEILQILKDHQIDWIFLAGYMRLISADFLKAFSAWHHGETQIVNIHPSLLPAYPGANSMARAHQDGVSQTGVTLHFVDEGMDTGAVIRQESVTIENGESLESLATRMHHLEHQIYTDFLASLASREKKTVHFQETT